MKHALLAIGCALSGSVLLAGSDATVLRLPLDSDLRSSVAGVADPLTFSWGSISFLTEGMAGTAVGGEGETRDNGGFVRFSNSCAFYDLTAAGLTDTATIEFHVRANSTEVGEWSGGAVLGVHAGPQTMEETAFADPFLFLMQVQVRPGGTTAAFRSDFWDWSSASRKDNCSPWLADFFNGQWHQVAVSYEPVVENGATKTRVTTYVDHARLGEYVSAFPWTCGTTTDRPHLYLKLGAAGNVFDFDEVRVSKRALDSRSQLCISDAADPVDGETLVYMPFDGTCDTLAHAEEPPTILSGTPTYSTDVKHVNVRTGGVDRVLLRENAQCLEVPAYSSVQLDLPYWGLGREFLDSATIEFFVKGESALVDEVWANPFQICRNDVPFAAMMQVYPSGNYVLRVDGYGELKDSMGEGDYIGLQYASNCSSSDGHWHHVAYTIEANPDGSSAIHVFVDRVEIGSGVLPAEKAWRGIDEGMRLSLGKSPRRYWFDELRITKGVLPKASWLRLEGETSAPVDGDALLHMTFDNNCGSVAHAEDQPVLLAGTPAYSADVWKTGVSSVRNGSVEWRENVGCIVMDPNSSVKIALPYEGLSKEELKSATIEFFVKGDPTATPDEWCTPMKICANDVPFFFLMQIYPGGVYNFRVNTYDDANPTDVGTYDCRPEGAFSDGCWHHVAMTIAANEDGTSTIACYFDHRLAGEPYTPAPGCWKGLAEGMTLQLSGGWTMRFRFDELRVSKGVLDPSRFMRARNGTGMILSFR